MRKTFELISNTLNSQELGFARKQNQHFVIHALRTAFLVAILAIAIVFQVTQDNFINVGVWLPVYAVLMTAFLLNSIYLFYYDKLKQRWFSDVVLFGLDALAITFLIYFTGSNQSIFIFLYLVNIILAGLSYQKSGALFLALWTSILFSILIIVSPQMQGQNLYFAVGLNNFAFFTVAILSGMLSQQIDFMGSQLKAQREDLEALRDFNQLIVENIATGLLTIDDKYIVTHANRASGRILEDFRLEGKNLFELFPKVIHFIRSGELTPHKATRIEVEYVNFKNEKMNVEVIVSMLQGPEKELRGYMLLFQDLTHVKRMEYQMRQQEKMAAVGQLAAGIAHEIRNPLASISGSIQMMAASESGLDEDNRKLMRIVLKEIDRLNGLISEFLDYVRPDTRVEDPVNMNAVIKEVLEMARFNKNLRNDVEQSVNLRAQMMVLGHFDKLKQAILNIVINAFQAMDKSATPALKVETFDREDMVVVVIEDNGVGIDENNLMRIFEPFHTTKPKGTGLGLAITHKILETHNARIFVESKMGSGTKITIEFPVHNNPERQDEMAMKRQA